MSSIWTPDIENPEGPVYVAILQALEEDIVSGNLRPGDRLPTHRKLANQLGLAIGTVTKAYREAERQGLIRGDGRRGTFVGQYRRRPETLLTRSTEPGIIDLSPYYPPANADPDLSHTLSQLAKHDINYLTRYNTSRGYTRHREAGAKWVAGLGLKVDEEEVVITAGAQHATLITLTSCAKRGDVIVSARHTYPGLKWATDLAGLKLIGIESDDEGLLPDALESCCAKHRVRFLYCIPTLDNPTNAIMSESRRRALADVAEKHGVEIIEDEINRRLVKDPPPLMSSIAPDRTFLIASLSKVVAGGLRICYLIAPSRYRDRLLRGICSTTLVVAPLMAELAAQWISDGTAERTVVRKRAEAEKRSRVAVEALSGLDFNSAPTSYFVWLKLPERWHPTEFAAETHRRGVIVAPSDLFAVDSTDIDRAARICLGGHVDLETLERGLKVLASILRGDTCPESVVF
ncbi:MAG: PLP-dependent aminotransferase family protein [Candidatus Zixiibacteriota bacterium]|nr:MAG: PLP-dependent aminotransferase family protein [candidate division Zixibacteria bacterium]